MKYFTFGEFGRSDTATRYAINNAIPEAAKRNIAALVDNVLDPLRQAWGKPITVTSGYLMRCGEGREPSHEADSGSLVTVIMRSICEARHKMIHQNQQKNNLKKAKIEIKMNSVNYVFA